MKSTYFLALAVLTFLGALGFGTTLAHPHVEDQVIVDAMTYPWSALGRVNTGGKGYCTGVLVGRSHVLTEARCLYNATEGRWWSPSELHFVAGYQRDSYQIHSSVRRVHVAPSYQAGRWILANTTNNWAVLFLDHPIGLAAGWLAVQWRDVNALRRLERGEAYLFDVGYRAARSHVVTVSPACRFGALVLKGFANRHGCLRAEAGLAKLIFISQEFRILAPMGMPREVAGYDPKATQPLARPPEPGSPARRETVTTIRDLLDRLEIINTRATASEVRSSIADGG